MAIREIPLNIFERFRTGGTYLLLKKGKFYLLLAPFGQGGVRWVQDEHTVKVAFNHRKKLGLRDQALFEISFTPPSSIKTMQAFHEDYEYKEILVALGDMMAKCKPYQN